MHASSAVLVLSALAAQGSASRIKVHASLSHESNATLGWLIRREKYCTGKPATLECDDNSIIMVKQAKYNRQKIVDEEEVKACAPVQSSGESCDVEATEAVDSKCSGQRTCVLQPTDHPWCSEAPFTGLRVVYECVTGNPPTAVVDAQLTDHQEDEEELEVIPKKKKKEYIKHKVEQLVNTPEAEADLKPCFRYTRWELLKNLKFISPLTSCATHEGCFKVTFPNEVVYTDPEKPPTPKELLQSQYSIGSDSKWLTFAPVGLQRNEYDTWGVCLPKGEGIDFAMETFDRLKAAR